MCMPTEGYEATSIPSDESFVPLSGRPDCASFSEQQQAEVTGGSGSGSPPSSDGNGGGGNGDGDEEPSRNDVLRDFGKADTDIPADIRSMSAAQLRAYLTVMRNGFCSFLATFWPGWRRRVAADPEFPFKLLMEQTVGLGLTVSGMIAARGKNILNELDFAICDTIVGATMNFVLVYLLTPVFAPAAVSTLARLPANLFAQGQFSIAARIGGFVYKSALFSVAGFAASLIGTTVSQGLVAARRSGKKNTAQANTNAPKLPNVWVNSAAWAGFMFVSSSPRYQALAGFERLLFTYSPGGVAKLGSGLLRTGNNVLGGATWVMWAKAIGLQKSGSPKEVDNNTAEIKQDSETEALDTNKEL